MKTALITGGANRIGAQIAKTLHNYYNIIIHYKSSYKNAFILSSQLNKLRKNSASIIKADLTDINTITKLASNINNLNLLINNAAVFYPVKFTKFNKNSWEEIINVNLLAPFLLSQTLQHQLQKNQGCIINIIDIYSECPLKNYSIYNISKAALAMLTKTLAKELAPKVRVCGVSPGFILPAKNQNENNDIINKIPLAKQGSTEDIANTVLFLATSSYITGQIIKVDGGRSLNQ